MKSQERKMVDILMDLKENHHVIGVKTEFEDEGTQLEEATRLKEIVTMSGLDLTIKVGGCGALRLLRRKVSRPPFFDSHIFYHKYRKQTNGPSDHVQI